MIIIKVTKNKDLTLFVEKTFLEEPQGMGKFTPCPSLFRAKSCLVSKINLFKGHLTVF